MPELEVPKAKIAGSGRVLRPDGALRTDAPPPTPEDVKHDDQSRNRDPLRAR